MSSSEDPPEILLHEVSGGRTTTIRVRDIPGVCAVADRFVEAMQAGYPGSDAPTIDDLVRVLETWWDVYGATVASDAAVIRDLITPEGSATRALLDMLATDVDGIIAAGPAAIEEHLVPEVVAATFLTDSLESWIGRACAPAGPTPETSAPRSGTTVPERF